MTPRRNLAAMGGNSAVMSDWTQVDATPWAKALNQLSWQTTFDGHGFNSTPIQDPHK